MRLAEKKCRQKSTVNTNSKAKRKSYPKWSELSGWLYMISRKLNFRPGGTTLWLRTCTALVQDLTSFPTTHVRSLSNLCNSSSKGCPLMNSSKPAHTCAHMDTCARLEYNKNKSFLKYRIGAKEMTPWIKC